MRVSEATKRATRQRILETARKLFAQEGFETATTRDIARLAQIATGTLFNYFPTKESIVLCLVNEAHATVAETASTPGGAAGTRSETSLEEDLFAHVAAGLRKLKPYRRCLPAALELSLSPVATESEAGSFREAHLDAVSRIISRHDRHEGLTPLALQLYWTLYTGLLAYWSRDSSPKQEDSLALLDQSMAMFVGWLISQPGAPPSETGE